MIATTQRVLLPIIFWGWRKGFRFSNQVSHSLPYLSQLVYNFLNLSLEVTIHLFFFPFILLQSNFPRVIFNWTCEITIPLNDPGLFQMSKSILAIMRFGQSRFLFWFLVHTVFYRFFGIIPQDPTMIVMIVTFMFYNCFWISYKVQIFIQFFHLI